MRGSTTEFQIPAGPLLLEGELTVPLEPQGLVVFAHGSGSTRHSPRNQSVAQTLQGAHLATLLFDLLTKTEEREDANAGHLRFDIELLANRLVHAAEAIQADPELGRLPLGFFGASTGGGAALVAAAKLGKRVGAVVSRGGRTDLAGAALAHVQCPTLLVVGGDDDVVLQLNQQAMVHLRCEKELRIVPGASHLFEEPGSLAEVADHAAAWFRKHFPGECE